MPEKRTCPSSQRPESPTDFRSRRELNMANSRRMNGPSLAVHTFDVYLAGVAELTGELENRLFEAGCDDALLAMKNGRVYLTFDREARSREDAIDSALRNIADAGYSYEEIRVPQAG
ncbi:MAG TPA: hypothetical protein VGN42_03520 [Pirellulales bacterium]|nr:hypothetical protein [Pirellulales bacterium]